MHFIDVSKTERKLGFHAKGNFFLKFMLKIKKMCLPKQGHFMAFMMFMHKKAVNMGKYV